MKISNYEMSLRKQARLFSLCKSHADLFLLLQVNTITYQQLAMTGIHGKTEASGRLSLKRLERDGLIQAKEINSLNQTKYYLITPKGKALLKDLFPEELLIGLQVDFNRRLPNGNQQILHKIRTNDFYLSFISSPYSHPLPWLLEQPLPQVQDTDGDPLPRCDGLLKSEACNYYIEQDNSTQSETIIAKKISQYLQSTVFANNCSISNALVFCMAFPKKQPLAIKPSFSLYKILLKFTKTWKFLEEEYGLPLDYLQFSQVLDSSTLKAAFSANEIQAFQTLRTLHPDMDTLEEANGIKKAYLDDTGYMELQLKEMDVLFKKRLKSHFTRLHVTSGDLHRLMLAGIRIYAIPNHRLDVYQPFIMGKEYRINEHLLKCLFYSGLNTDSWHYHSPFRLSSKEELAFWFRQGFHHPGRGSIIVECIEIDLGAKLRINHYLKNHVIHRSLLFLLIASRESAGVYYNETKELRSTPKNKNIMFCYIEDKHSLFQDPPPYIYKLDSAHGHAPVLLEYDELDEQIHLLTREVDK